MSRLLLGLVLWVVAAPVPAQSCGDAPTQLQILGSGGTKPNGKRAGPAALLWVHGKARVLIDAGPATALRLQQAEADIGDLDAILLSNLRSERSADLPALMTVLETSARTRPLPLYGPAGNRWMPSTVAFVRTLFDPTRGAWRHLGDPLSPLARQTYRLEAHDLRARPAKIGVGRDERNEPLTVLAGERMRIRALPILAGSTPTLLWRIEAGGKSVAVAADMAGAAAAVREFVQGADLLLATPGASQEKGVDVAELARLAQAAGIKRLVLSADAAPAPGYDTETAALLRRHYHGPIDFASDLACLAP
jgi:ribonuclease BN (tRNA processing enzyme)